MKDGLSTIGANNGFCLSPAHTGQPGSQLGRKAMCQVYMTTY